jgi:hypothetical protein
MANKKDNAEQKSITVNVSFQGQTKGQEIPQARVYLFDRAGRFLDSKPVDGKPLAFLVDVGPQYQLRVGPDLLKFQKAVPTDLVAQLNKARAITQDYIPAIHGDALSVIIDHLIWPCWIFPTCINVHGTVRKLLNPGGTRPVYASICQGTVQIFQVDLECTLDTLAPAYLLSLRDSLVGRLTLTEQVSPAINPGDPGPGVSQAKSRRRGAVKPARV